VGITKDNRIANSPISVGIAACEGICNDPVGTGRRLLISGKFIGGLTSLMISLIALMMN